MPPDLPNIGWARWPERSSRRIAIVIALPFRLRSPRGPCPASNQPPSKVATYPSPVCLSEACLSLPARAMPTFTPPCGTNGLFFPGGPLRSAMLQKATAPVKGDSSEATRLPAAPRSADPPNCKTVRRVSRIRTGRPFLLHSPVCDKTFASSLSRNAFAVTRIRCGCLGLSSNWYVSDGYWAHPARFRARFAELYRRTM